VRKLNKGVIDLPNRFQILSWNRVEPRETAVIVDTSSTAELRDEPFKQRRYRC